MTGGGAAGEEADERAVTRAAVPPGRGLSAKLLLLTILFVLIAEVLIFLPSVANFRLRWLEERLNTAAAVGIVLLQTDPISLTRDAQDDVLNAIGAKAIALRDDEGVSRLLVVAEMPPAVDQHIDLSSVDMVSPIIDALETAFFGGGRMLRVFGPVGDSNKQFELVIPDDRLKQATLVYSRNVAIVSLLISLSTAALVFWAINRIMIRPVRDMTRSMLDFAEAPTEPGRIIVPEAERSDEIGVAERELASMQSRLQRLLGEQRHLADLGLAVSKINHDMRNILSSAQLLSDRLRAIKDPAVQAFAPKLLRSLDRAVAYTEDVLAYGRAQEPAPKRRLVRLRELVDEVFGLLSIDAVQGVEFDNMVDSAFEIDADSEQLFRVLTNLGRNALQAMASDPGIAVVKRLTVAAEREGAVARIRLTDTGPGLPQKARENLFAAFRGSARSGGTGLGLAIASELVRAHGGTLELVESIGGRTVFQIAIPDQPVSLDERRGALRRPA